MKSLIYKGGSVLSRRNCSHIVAKHPRKGVQVAQIQHFCFHQVKQSSHGLPFEVISIIVNWYEPHPERFWLSTSVFVCCNYHSGTSFIFLTDEQLFVSGVWHFQLVQKLFYVLCL
jgi:hypothetical protein